MGASRGIMVELEKQVHLQKDVGAVGVIGLAMNQYLGDEGFWEGEAYMLRG